MAHAKLRRMDPALAWAVVGLALLSGAIDPAEAVAVLEVPA